MVRGRSAKQIHHRNETIQACPTEGRGKLQTVVVVVVALQTADRLRVMYHTVGIQQVLSAIFA